MGNAYSPKETIINPSSPKGHMLFKNKKAGIPYWLMMLIYSLIGLIVILGLMILAKEKSLEIINNIFG